MVSQIIVPKNAAFLCGLNLLGLKVVGFIFVDTFNYFLCMSSELL